MTRPARNEEGFTLVELLVSIFIFAVLSTSFFLVMLGGTRGSEITREVVSISEEARLGLNRMVRDTREAQRLTAVGPDSYTILVDFNRDGDVVDADEEETFEFVDGTITLNDEVLVRGVAAIGAEPVFSFSSNNLEDYDGSTGDDPDGIATLEEVQFVEGADVFPALTQVAFAIEVNSENRESEFRTEAQLRNRR